MSGFFHRPERAQGAAQGPKVVPAPTMSTLIPGWYPTRILISPRRNPKLNSKPQKTDHLLRGDWLNLKGNILNQKRLRYSYWPVWVFFFPFHGGIGKLQNRMRSVMENKEHSLFLKIWVIAFKFQSPLLLAIPVSRWRHWGSEVLRDCPMSWANSCLLASKSWTLSEQKLVSC